MYRLLERFQCSYKYNKRKVLGTRDVRQKHLNKFVISKDEHYSTEATKLNFFDKKHLFHIVADDFPLHEDGILGLKFSFKHDRCVIMPNYLILNNKGLLLHVDGKFTPDR